jgi:hypothetical protein
MTQLLARVGGSMPKVDIRGIAADGRPIAAQVTYSAAQSTIAFKQKALQEWGANTSAYLLLFCDIEQEVLEDKILKIPIKDVFDRFTATTEGQRWLRVSFGVLGTMKLESTYADRENPVN